MEQQQIINAIHRVLRDTLAHPHLSGFGPDARLNEDLYLDSIQMLQLLLHLELDWGFTIPEQALGQEDFTTVAGLAAFLERSAGETEPAVPDTAGSEPGEGVHGEEYEDIKVHCFVSCVCDALKQAGIDHRPYYFSVWDADFAIEPGWVLSYHAPSINHDIFHYWFERLYGIPLQQWYRPDASRADNIATLCELVEQRPATGSVMVMLDLYQLPERENKFNQNPFPHYVLLETTADPDVWMMRDPDYRWEGELPRARILQAVDQPTVAGGWRFDRSTARPAPPEVVRDYFLACFQPERNALTEGVRRILQAHLNGTDGVQLSNLSHALRELPVISVRKYGYEHAFAFFWRELKLADADFESWCAVIESLIQGFKTLHYQLMKLGQSGDEALVPAITQQLDTLDDTEFRLKGGLAAVFADWCAHHGLAAGDADVMEGAA
ncbi:DUF6005 family protein [Oceanimonas sp. CHS3-5]|uniref:DUF6005 family protein n=1 Tax=Oceanimonas sp. CHS3-5 TaxID=3068186 RepID=UPI00273E71D1|nr:DUF6005 family protein [Oceanimonas sp. CHS3-5]MDP5291800.1 DUF6005 family protein [Oceanimonas sp. CHS3-5]